jgi:hypothetical protein
VEPKPIAAASIGQVYKARLRTTGELVAVKVRAVETDEVPWGHGGLVTQRWPGPFAIMIL